MISVTRAHEDSDAPAVDVAQTYMKHRMVSFSEAIVRLIEAPVVRRFPPVDTINSVLQVHLEASAGSRRTFLCLCMAMAVREQGKSSRCAAFAAKAASNHPDGDTAHYEFQLNVTPSRTRPAPDWFHVMACTMDPRMCYLLQDPP